MKEYRAVKVVDGVFEVQLVTSVNGGHHYNHHVAEFEGEGAETTAAAMLSALEAAGRDYEAKRAVYNEYAAYLVTNRETDGTETQIFCVGWGLNARFIPQHRVHGVFTDLDIAKLFAERLAEEMGTETLVTWLFMDKGRHGAWRGSFLTNIGSPTENPILNYVWVQLLILDELEE